jgi:hypothetical protein
MRYMINHPRVLTLACLLAMWLLALGGAFLRQRSQRRARDIDPQVKETLTLVVSATLTLLGLIIGFTFSMATTRYDQRKLYEEQEANAIGTEYVRAELLPADQTNQVKFLLGQYLQRRIAFYTSSENPQNSTLDLQTARLQTQLWNSIKPQAAATPTPVEALVVSGMNDVLNSQGYTQFSWWNRIPTTAWWFLIGIALFANLLVGYATPARARVLLFVLPMIVAVSFFLVADLDDPRGGLIHIAPRDLMALADSFRPTA